MHLEEEELYIPVQGQVAVVAHPRNGQPTYRRDLSARDTDELQRVILSPIPMGIIDQKCSISLKVMF